MPGQLPKSLRASVRIARRATVRCAAAAAWHQLSPNYALSTTALESGAARRARRTWRGAGHTARRGVHGEAFLAAARLRLSSALETDRWNFFKLTLDCNVNTPYSQLTAVCGATRRLMPILFETKHGLYAVPRQFSVFHTHSTSFNIVEEGLVVLTLTLHNNFLFGSIGAHSVKK